MKLLRAGDLGKEKVAALDADNIIRDLSEHIEDLTPQSFNDTTLRKLKSIDLSKEKEIDSSIRIGSFIKDPKNYLNRKIGRLNLKAKEFRANNFFCTLLLSGDKEIKLLIIGEGEEKAKLQKIIKEKKLNNKIFLLNKTENVFQYMKNAKAFILSSLWEDPGHVIIEAALSNLFVISSNCPNGPSEFLNYGKSGILFQSNLSGELTKSLKYFIENENILKKNKIYAKKNCLKYTKFRHYRILQKIF